jgi:hypothetical protein
VAQWLLYVPDVAPPGLAQVAYEASAPESVEPEELPELEPDDDPDELPLDPPEEEDPPLELESSLLASGVPLLLLLLEHAAATITSTAATPLCVVRHPENAVR